MDIHAALIVIKKDEKLSFTQLAAIAGVTEAAARRWVSERATPNGDALLKLMDAYPALRDMLFDGEAVA